MRYGAEFRYTVDSTGGQQNLIDALTPGSTGNSNWTTGAAIVDSVALPIRSVKSTWRIYSVSFTARLLMIVNYILPATGIASRFGKLGALNCGMSLQGPQTISAHIPGGPAYPYTTLDESPLPRDSSLVSRLWDPATNPLPPINYLQTPHSPAELLDLSGGITPPQPIDMPAGGSLYAGLWLEPALMSCYAPPGVGSQLGQWLAVYSGQYEIYFDEL